MTPCPHCCTRAAAEYLARGRRRALGNVFGVVLALVLALVLMAVGAALVTRNGPSAPVRSRHV